MDLDTLQRIKRWHVAHQKDHPVEYHIWDAMLTLWLAGWVGWIPAFTFDALWAAPLLAVALSTARGAFARRTPVRSPPTCRGPRRAGRRRASRRRSRCTGT